MFKVDMQIPDLSGVEKAFNNLAEQIKNPDVKLMRRLGDTIIEDVDKRYMARGYGIWSPLKPETIKRKGHDNPLIETGAMFASSQITKMDSHSVTVGVPYGGRNHDPRVPGFHQYGTSRMPVRQIVAKTPQLVINLKNTLQNWVNDMTKAFRTSI